LASALPALETDLPSELRAGLDDAMYGVSRNALIEHAGAISKAYRAGANSAHAVRNIDDALAYALTRMPATFAAVVSVLDELRRRLPDFAPRSLLDVGAGPGTAAWAATQCFVEIERITLVDANEHLRQLALDLMRLSPVLALRDARYERGSAQQLLRMTGSADLTIASYFVGESPDSELLDCVDVLWSKAADTLVIIEPGTPAGFERIRTIRSHLIGRQAFVVCPCPHDLECPLTGDDWCHFSQRLNRSRDHRVVKAAALPFEDEKYSYVVLSRHKLATPSLDRVLAPPHVTKSAITAKLCTLEGLVMDVAPRRDRDAYKLRRNWRWGDAVTRAAKSATQKTHK
jgi:ribosomal protein RSM22 (predicted rRNA methylase)